MQAAIENATAVTSIARDIKAEMSAYMVERGECTREDLLQRFTPKQVDQYGPAAARDATRRAERRHA